MERFEFLGLWLQGPEDPGIGAGMLVGGTETQRVPGLVLAHWWEEPGPKVSGCKVLGLMPVHWCMGPGPAVAVGSWALGAAVLLVGGAESQLS